jgi:thymidylate kinase
MEAIFKTIGHTISKTQAHSTDKVLEILYIKNPDGTPRWIWKKSQNQPLFLKFYSISSFRAKCFAALIHIIFYMKLQGIIFSSKKYYTSSQTKTLIDLDDQWALFTGTIGPNNKAVLYANNSFYKIATTKKAQKLISNEHQMLTTLKGMFPTLITPKSDLILEQVIQLSDVSGNGKRTKNITSAQLDLLTEMSTIQTTKTIAVKDWSLFNRIKKDFLKINDARIPANMIRKINILIQKINPEEKVSLSLAHGDFTQWNMFEECEKIALYDWELASFERPKAFDYFHYMIQNSVLIERKNWSEIYESIIHNCTGEFGEALFENDKNHLNQYLKWYLLLNCMSYLKVYSTQPKWHIQIEWLMQTWNEGLNTFLTQEKTARELLIMDIFDSIQNQDYAALKFRNGFPEQLNINSDIDLVIDKRVNNSILNLLEKHALISKISTNKRSFMNTIQVFLNDGTFLSLDLIWLIKRKNLVFLDSKKIIADSYLNNYGIKSASSIDIARYTVFFNVLNGVPIPNIQLDYEQAIQHSTITRDSLLREYYCDTDKSKVALFNCIKKDKINQGFNYIKNSCLYLLDTAINLFNNKGFTITFSGVDGAGKSTVIENIAIRIEKQLRKPVIILRHRPSILPILSVWTKGKEKAHKDAIESLPRQGKNKSVWSSLLRFTYYYMDYVLGQFVVYFKHIIRGHVVIYDRYYFDFINDSKRSNIVLPKNISAFGYRFLLKPKFNFFLFADADVILKRKQELNKKTIEKLTHDYHSLFDSLGAKSHYSIYETINNTELETTLNKIVTTLIQAER